MQGKIQSRYLDRLENRIRKNPFLYQNLRKVIPYINLVFSVERDFKALKCLSKFGNSKLALDIGYNDGLSSISILRNSRYEIIAFEPLQIPIYFLPRLVLKNIQVHKFGLGSENGTTEIYIPTIGKKKLTPYASTLRDLAIDNIARDCGIEKDQIQIDVEKISIKKLDDFHLEPQFIKIDTEGTELDILKGAIITINKARPFILLEISNSKNFKSIETFAHLLNYQVLIYKKGNFIFSSDYVQFVRNYWLLPNEVVNILKITY